MYLMYVDESGDSGLVGSPTSHFGLSGLVVHESDWRATINQLIAFRKTLRASYGLPVRTEIHASEYLRSPPVPGMPRHIRLAILRNLIDEVAKIPGASVTNVIVNKIGKPAGYDVFESAWKALFQRFENTLIWGNFPGRHRNDYGLVLTDATDGNKLQRLVRKMAVYNPIPNQAWAGPGTRNLPILRVIEDPHPKDSKDSLFIQACDTTAYFLHQAFAPNSFVRKIGAQNYLARLRPVLNLRASRHALGVVVL
jgi:hypothetical protein